jgi:polar amino acid transport system substrate-binding protein
MSSPSPGARDPRQVPPNAILGESQPEVTTALQSAWNLDKVSGILFTGRERSGPKRRVMGRCGQEVVARCLRVDISSRRTLVDVRSEEGNVVGHRHSARDIRRGSPWKVLVSAFAVVLAAAACSSSGAPASASQAAPPAASAASSASTNPLPESALLTRIKQAGTMKAGVAISLPAVGLDPNSGKYFGTGVDLGQMMADKLGVKLELVPTDWNVMVAGIQSDKIDVAIAGLFITKERLAVVDMSPWTTQGFCYAVLKTNNKINSIADLNSPNVTMAQQEGGGTYQITKAKYPLAKQLARLPAPGEDANWTEVLSGKADTAPFDSTLANAVPAAFPQMKVIPSDCATNPDEPSKVGAAYKKGDAGFRQFIEQLIADNTAAIEASRQKYISPDYLQIKH